MRVETYSSNSVNPFHIHTIGPETTYKPTASDQVPLVSNGSASFDVLHWFAPTLRSDNVYSGAFSVISA